MKRNVLMKINTVILAGLCVVTLCSCNSTNSAEVTAVESSSSDETLANASSSEEKESLGVLGTDCSLGDLNEDTKGKELTLTGTYFTATNNKYPYLFSYKEQQDDGTISNYNFYIKDETAEKVLSVLEDASYEDEIVVKITGIYDDTVIEVLNDDKENASIHYYVTATEAEILDSDSSEAKAASGNYYYAGDTIQFENGTSFIIKDTGMYTEYSRSYAYVEVNIENQSGGDIQISASDAKFYGDDFSLNTGFPSATDANNFVNIVISDGRMASGRFYAECSDFNKISRIEAEIGDAIVVIKDDSIVNETTTEEEEYEEDLYVEDDVDITYGTYFYDNGMDLQCSAEVGSYSDGLAMGYVSIGATDYDGNGIINYIGDFEERSDGTYHAYCSAYNAEIILDFVEGGMNVTVYTTSDDTVYSLEGFYTLDSEFNSNEVS